MRVNAYLLQSRCSAKEGSFPLQNWWRPSSPACREAGVRDRGNGSYPVSVSSPSCSLLPHSDPGTSVGGATFVCVCHRVEMGCSASRAEDDSLGYGPGTLGKARPASGLSPRELRGREKGAGPV